MLPAGSTLFKKNKRRRDSLPSPRKAFKNQTPEEPTENPTRKPKPSQSYQTPTTQNNQAKGAAILGWCEGHSEVYSGCVWDDTKAVSVVVAEVSWSAPGQGPGCAEWRADRSLRMNTGAALGKEEPLAAY